MPRVPGRGPTSRRHHESIAHRPEHRPRCGDTGTDVPGQFVRGGQQQEAPRAAHTDPLA